MPENKFLRDQLNQLAEKRVAASIKDSNTWSTLFRYEPLLQSVAADMNNKDKFDAWLAQGGCYVFEIGINCGTVFSVSVVKNIQLTEQGAIISLKG